MAECWANVTYVGPACSIFAAASIHPARSYRIIQKHQYLFVYLGRIFGKLFSVFNDKDACVRLYAYTQLFSNYNIV